MSPLVIYDRNGPPGALRCPAIVCDFCGELIQEAGAETSGHVIWWERYDGPGRTPTRSPLFFTHQRCDRKEHLPTYTYENGWGSCWNSLGEFLDHLQHNLTHPFADDQDGEFVAPIIEAEGS